MNYRQGDLRGRYEVELSASEEGSIGQKYNERRTLIVLAVDVEEARNKAYSAAYAMGLEHVRIESCFEVLK